jgi:hypothetical protein
MVPKADLSPIGCLDSLSSEEPKRESEWEPTAAAMPLRALLALAAGSTFLSGVSTPFSSAGLVSAPAGWSSDGCLGVESSVERLFRIRACCLRTQFAECLSYKGIL